MNERPASSIVEFVDRCLKKSEPLPLFPPLPEASPYPVDALGPVLAEAAAAISRKVQVPDAMAAQSVLAAASLACSAHADVVLPFGQARPLAMFFLTAASSGDRKSSADNEALWPLRKREQALKEEHREAIKGWKIDFAAWTAEKRKIEGNGSLDLTARKMKLTAIGPEPEKPLEPMLLSGNPTLEGLIKAWPGLPPVHGIFTTEGGMFTGGHAMNQDNLLSSAAMLSELWDGKPVRRVRAIDGISILHGRRLAIHLLIQPDAAGSFLLNPLLRDQGLLSRVLVAAPASKAGSRLWREPDVADNAAIKRYGARLLSILETAPPLEPGTRNELTPRELPLSAAAKDAWIEFHNHIEKLSGEGGALAEVRDFASKAAEHAARLSGILTLVADLHAAEIGSAAMEGALLLTDWYVAETSRLSKSGRVDVRLLRAQALLNWLKSQPSGQARFRELLQFGPNATRTKESAEEAIKILLDHGLITEPLARPRLIQAVGT
jgi:hypothetical protein